MAGSALVNFVKVRLLFNYRKS